MVHCRWLWGVNIFMLKISDRPNENKWTWFSWISFHHCFHDFHTGVTISWNEVIESQMPSPVPLYIDKRISMQLPWNLQKHSLSTVWKSFWTVWNKMMFLLKTAVGQNWVPQYLYHYIYIIYIYDHTKHLHFNLWSGLKIWPSPVATTWDRDGHLAVWK
jgi:hypothetical protein